MEKFKVSFTADNQQLKAIGTKHASDTYADIEAEFVLGNRWTDMDSVSAVWWNDFTRIATVLDPQGKCIVPHEVLARKGCVRVNLVGSVMEGDELVTRLTSYSAEAVQVNEKIKLTGSETSEITPSQFEQFVAMVISEVEKVTGMTATAETLPAGSDATARYENGVLHLGIPQGIQGETGNGIESVVFDNYALRFTFTDGTVFTTPSIRGADGNGIRSIAKTGTSGLVDTYTITFDDGSTTTYTVTNGAKGEKGETGATPSFSIGTVETLEPTEDATATITGTAENPVLNLGIPQGKTGEVTYEDLESILPRDTASGQIASFPDGQSVIPMHSLKVSLEPIQDLHGYDKPWSGGNGKNKFPFINGGTQRGVTATVSTDGSVTLNGTANGVAFFYTDYFTVKAGRYAISSGIIERTVVATYLDGVSGSAFEGAVLTFNEETTTRGIVQVYNGQTASNVTVYPMLRLASETDANYAPYSNICPISGHTEVVTQRTGKNLCNIEYGADVPSVNTGQMVNVNGWRTDFVEVDNTKSYVMSYSGSKTNYILFYNSQHEYLGNAFNQSLYLLSNYEKWSQAKYIKARVDGVSADTFQMQLELGSTATDYEAFEGDTYTTTLGRTVYGGTLDVVSGELVVDRAMVDLGDLTWAKLTTSGSNYWFRASMPNIAIQTSGSVPPKLVCSQYETITENDAYTGTTGISSITNAPYIVVVDMSYTDATAFKTAMSGVQLVYELATPQTYQLTPQEVRTLLGTNNVWSDGDVVVVYSADTALWIEKKLNA